jgi:aldehyde:ferredoxin oxidoreductase
MAGVSSEARSRIFGGTNSPLNIGRFTKYVEDWRRALDCLGICGSAQPARMFSARSLAEAYSALTGMHIGSEEFLKIGERAHNLERALHSREGFGRKQDIFPDKWLEPARVDGEESPTVDYFKTARVSRESLSAMIEDYYDERGWDPTTGNPYKSKLRELGLEFAVDQE